MKKLWSLYFIISFIIVSTFLLPAHGENQDEIELIPGSERPEIKHCGVDTIYIYKALAVYSKPSGEYEGNNIYVFKHTSMKDHPCQSDLKRADYTILVGEFGGANNFIGANGNIIFLDQWTGRDFKRLLGINVDRKSLVFLDTYTKPEIKNGELLYYRTLKAKRKSVRDNIPCPEAQQWKADGKQVLYVERMSANLDTMKKQSSGEFSCMPSEPIRAVKTGGGYGR